MEPPEPSLTHPGTLNPNMLLNAEGQPLKVNLQAVELEGRPKLVRTLKGSGALVLSNAKEAYIILVDSATESGKRLIRTWGHDASKVVLEHSWVRACVSVGRALLEADNWGGAMTIDDGKPVTIDGVVVDEDELEEVEALVTKSPLPTPRVTPVDAASQRSENATNHIHVTGSNSLPNISAPNPTGLSPPAPLTAQPTMVGTALSEEAKVNVLNDIKPPQSLQPQPATQPLSYLQPALPVQPPQAQNNTYAYAPFTSHQSYPSSHSQTMPSQPFLQTNFSSLSSQQQIGHAPNLPHALAASQPHMMQMAPNSGPINGVNLQNPNFSTIMTIMEVVRHMDQSNRFTQNHSPVSPFSQPPTCSITSPFSVQPPAASAPAPSSSGFQPTEKFESLGTDASLSDSQDHLSDVPTSSWKDSSRDISGGRSATRKSRIRAPRGLPEDISVPSSSRKRPSAVKPANPPPKRLRKGKERADSVYSSEHSDVDDFVVASDGSYSTNTSTSIPERPRLVIARKKHGEIFLSESGQSLRFFVQVDLHGRYAVVTNIKKNKGKIVNSISDADYVILSSRSDTFQGLLNEAIASDKPPVLAAFVADCVEEGGLLDESEYILGSVAKVKTVKRGRQNAFSIKIETTETLSRQIKAAKPKSSPITRADKKLKEAPSKSSVASEPKKAPTFAASKPVIGEDSTKSRSPTPPPAHTRRAMKNGKYLFTQAEDEYILRFAKCHLDRDPTISNTALVGKLHKKMPHHTLASWATHIDQKLKSAVENLRKRANIAKRKRDSEATNQHLSRGVANECTLSKGHISDTDQGNGEISLYPGQPPQENLERQDFEVITQFFASGGGDDDDDERVWRQLEKHSLCRSASSWPEYYATHQNEVYSRIEQLMNERVGDSTT